MASFSDQVKEIENAFLQNIYNLNVEDLEKVVNVASLENGPIDDSIFDKFENTYNNLLHRTASELDEIFNKISNENNQHDEQNENDKYEDDVEDINEEDKNIDDVPQTIIKKAIDVVGTANSTEEYKVHGVEEYDGTTHDIKNIHMNTNYAPADSFGGTRQEFKNFFTKNKDYHIYNPKGDGDCFFYVAQEALDGIDIKKTTHQLRELVSDNVDDSTIELYKSAYVAGPEEGSDIANPYEFIGQNNRTELLKAYILTQAYWADEFAISVIEKEYHVKFIIFSEQYKGNKLIKCTENDSGDGVKYILTSFTENHYRLITYNGKKILDTLPPEIIAQISKDCPKKKNP